MRGCIAHAADTIQKPYYTMLMAPAADAREKARLGVGQAQQELEGHLAAELRVTGAVDDAHAPAAQLLQQLVASDLPHTRAGLRAS